MTSRLRRWLRRHDWIRCDKCGRWRPRRWAYNRGWWCGGHAGHYDICTRHDLAGAFRYLARKQSGDVTDHAEG